ncbi:MAG: ribulose bisphosphate carboxylase small subunit [Solirubrobacteraceae bacterium]
MRITQGTFSYLPELTDDQITSQIKYSLEQGWAMSVEYTDDPHPRNSYWEMWELPQFDLPPDEAGKVLEQVTDCREAHPEQYIKVLAYDPRAGRQTTALSFIVNRPENEPGYRLDRTESHDRVIRYQLHPYATEQPQGHRYRDTADAGSNGLASQKPKDE